MPDNDNLPSEPNLEDLDPDEGTGALEEGSEAEGDALPAGQEFYDASQVPEGLRPTFKAMQAAFTRGMQRLASDGRSMNDLKYKADLFDNLMSNPKVVKKLNELEEGDEGLEGEGPEGASGDVSQAVRKMVAPLQAELQQMRIDAAVQRERDAFVAAHPDWERVKDGMVDAWKRDQSLSMEAAYRWAVHDNLLRKQAAIRKQRAAGQGSVEGAGTPRSARDNSVPNTVPSSFTEAYERARRKLGFPRETLE